MIDLEKIIKACNMAIEDSDDNFSNSLPFFELADPRAVLELVRMLEASTGRHELERILTLIRNMSAFLRAIPADFDRALSGARHELLSQADCILAVYD